VGFGVARLADIPTDDFLLPGATLNELPLAVSIALPVASEVLGTLEGAPNQLYEHHYRQVNFALDRLGLDLCRLVNSLGSRALAIPASQLVDWDRQRGHLSHKRVAVAAGLGWLGRNNLLVTPTHGAQVRLATVLTDLTMPPDSPLNQDCGPCRRCIAVCPCKAIGRTAADFRHQDCFAQLKEFQHRRLVSQYVCGLCVRACYGPAPSGCSGTPCPPTEAR
jgi:epoxyqueuosine reductase QueG